MPSILVVGDLLIDRYIYCKPKGISPEAPILSMDIEEIIEKPGGAGNVVMNLLALQELLSPGMKIEFLGFTFDDFYRTVLRLGKGDSFLPIQTDRPNGKTSYKNRIVCREPFRQVIRFDQDYFTQPTQIEEDSLSLLLEDKEYDIGLISDYGHGAITPQVCKLIRKVCKITIADPKGKDLLKYCGVTFLTPNTSEVETLTEGLKCRAEDKIATIQVLCGKNTNIVHKQGRDGFTFYSTAGTVKKYPPYESGLAVIDPTGAGDTFAAALAFFLALGKEIDYSLNAAGTLAGIGVTKPECFVPDANSVLNKF